MILVKASSPDRVISNRDSDHFSKDSKMVAVPILKKKAVTLVEILVAMVILALCTSGIIATFISAQQYSLHAKSRLQATNLARQKIEDLYKDVRQDTWDIGNLRANNYPNESIIIDGITYTRNYTVLNVTDQDYRNVTVMVRWNETQP